MLNRLRALTRFFKLSKEALEDTRDTLEELIETEEPSDTSLNPHEKQLFLNVLNFGDLTAADVMTPRAEIVSISETSSFEEALQTVSAVKRTLFPVYRETLDDVTGVMRAKDLLPYCKSQETFSVKAILRPVPFIAPNMGLLELLVQMRASGDPMVMVVDEFGGVDGLATLKDVISELVGNIQEENSPHHPTLTRRSDGLYVADARLAIIECEKGLGIPLRVPLEEDSTEFPEVDTLGGLATALAGHIPQRGECLEHPSGVVFEVLEADSRRIVRLGIHISVATPHACA
ncbi:MAG: CBS domain-containing protein [Holosporales bacterium]|jgi:CBS domain containing-hemolysin-like protein|nr:CBS domain-containing protein [Holosporales bacterium]